MSEAPEPPLPDLRRAFAVAQVVLLAVGWGMRPADPDPQATSFSYVLSGLGLVATAVWAVGPRLLPVERSDPRSRAVLRWGCAEAIGVCGLGVLVHGGAGWLGTALIAWGFGLVWVTPTEP